MTVTKERAMQMFDHDLDIMMDDLRGMQAHYQIAEWEAFIFLRKPDCPGSYVVKYAAASDEFAKQIVELHRQPRALVAAPPPEKRHYFCSCGGALTAEEYIEHYFEKGHDHGEPELLIKAAAAEIVKRFDLVAKVTQRNTVITDEIAAILSKHLGSAAVGEQDSLPIVVVRKAAQEPCRSYAKGCAANQPEESFWCAPCTARHLLAATPTSTQT